jgi:mRNA interferase MazF
MQVILTSVISCTTQVYRDAHVDGYALCISLGKLGKLKAETDALIDQIRAVANHRFIGSKPIAELSRVHMKRVEEALKILTG